MLFMLLTASSPRNSFLGLLALVLMLSTNPMWKSLALIETCPRELLPAFDRWVGVKVVDWLGEKLLWNRTIDPGNTFSKKNQNINKVLIIEANSFTIKTIIWKGYVNVLGWFWCFEYQHMAIIGGNTSLWNLLEKLIILGLFSFINEFPILGRFIFEH